MPRVDRPTDLRNSISAHDYVRPWTGQTCRVYLDPHTRSWGEVVEVLSERQVRVKLDTPPFDTVTMEYLPPGGSRSLNTWAEPADDQEVDEAVRIRDARLP